MPLTRLIYWSRRLDGSGEALTSILEVSQVRNEEDGITGALISTDDRFLQVLEGRRAPLSRCLGRIIRDPRHSDLQIIVAGEVRHRLFPTWAMLRVEASLALRLLVGRYAADGQFRPEQMSQLMIEDLCRRLAVDLSERPGA